MSLQEKPYKLVSLKQLKEDHSWEEKVEITKNLMEKFMDLTKDRAPAHVEADYAVKMGYDGCLVHGFLVGCGYSRILGMFLPGGNTVIHQLHLDMIAPVYVGDIITYQVCIDRVIDAVKSVKLKLSAVNQDGMVVNRGTAVCVFRL